MASKYTAISVGPIPADWEQHDIGDLATQVTNGFVGVASPHYTSTSGVRYLLGTNVRENRITSIDETYVTKEFSSKNKKSVLLEGDLLTVQSGHIGTTAVVPKWLAGSNCHALIITRLIRTKADPDFVAYYLNSEIGQARLRGLHVGSSILHINTSELAEFPIPVPPVDEQKRISKLLSRWDLAISTTESLIAAKQQRKQALMQQLLTGKKRLSGFKKPWAQTHIRSFLSESRIPGSDGSSAKKLTVKLYGNGVVPRSERIAGSDNTKYYRRKAGQFIYGKLDFLNGAFGIIPANLDSYESTLDLPAFDFSPGISPEFFLHFVGQTRFYAQFSGSAEGGRKARRIQVDEFLDAAILVPEQKEQAAIARVLGTVDLEMNLLIAKKSALEGQKKALMSVLLTGKKRIPANKSKPTK